MQIEINAVIITDSVDNMKKIKELLRAKAKTALNNAKDEDEGTRLDIDGFFIDPEVDEWTFFDELYELLGKTGAAFFAETDSNSDPYVEITYHIAGETGGNIIDDEEDISIGDIGDWLNRWKIQLNENMKQSLEHLGINVDGEKEESFADYVEELNTRFEEGLRLVGTQYEGRTERIENVKVGDPVYLIREPDSSYDRYAIDVRNDEGSLGHLDADTAKLLAGLIDEEMIECAAWVKEVIPLSQRGKQAKTAIITIGLELTSSIEEEDY